jgi:hypothetical protein
MAVHLGNDSAVRRQQWLDRDRDSAGDVAAVAEHDALHADLPAASPAALSRLLAPSPRDPNAQRARDADTQHTAHAPAHAHDLPPPRKDPLALIWRSRDERKLPEAPVVTRPAAPTPPAAGRSTIPERPFAPRAFAAQAITAQANAAQAIAARDITTRDITAPAQRTAVVGVAAAALGAQVAAQAPVPATVQAPVPAPLQMQPSQPPGRSWFGRIAQSLQARTEQTQDLAALRHAAMTLASSATLQGGPGWLLGMSQLSSRLHALAAALRTPPPTAQAKADAAALAQASSAVHERFAAQASNKEAFTALLRQAFGDKFDAAKAETIRQQALAGDFSWAPQVKVVDSAALADLSGTQGPGSALGAYVASSDTIYISRELLHGNPAQAQRLLMEELGHGLDARINTSDAVGDEGEIFSKLMHGDAISAPEMAALRADNDRGVININGQAVAVEYGFFSKIGKAITGGLKKVAGAVTKGVVNLAKSAVKVGTGLLTLDFDKVKDGLKDGVNAVKTSVKAVHEAVKDSVKEIHRITKQAFQKLMQSKLFAAVLMVCRFIPIPIVQLVVHIVDAVRAGYMVYQGIKHKSLGMVLGGVASLVGGAGNVAGALGASASTVSTIGSVANAASKLSMAYNAVANKDIGAALGLLGGASGVQGTALGTAAGYVQQGLGIRQAVRSGDAVAALGGTIGLAQSVSQQFGAGVQQQQQLQQREAEAADNRGLLNAADRDLRAAPAGQDGASSQAAIAAADDHRNGSDVDSDNTAARNGGVGPSSTQTLLTVGRGQTLEGIARAHYGENWRAGMAQMAIDNSIKLNQWGSPVLSVGNTLELPDIGGKSEQELASLARTSGRIIANNDKGLQAKAALEERVRVAEDVERIQRLTRYTQAARDSDPNYQTVLDANNRAAAYVAPGSSESLGDPDVRAAQALGFFDEGAGSVSPGVAPGALSHTSLAATAWRSDHEIKLGGALYAGVGGNAEITLALNPSRLDLSVGEFEWGVGVGFGAKAKAGWNALSEKVAMGSIPLGTLQKFGDGQANGTGAISLKAGLELSAPGTNFVAAEARFGVQSPLTGAAGSPPSGGFYEVKFGEFKVAPTLQLGATAKIDLFNNSYKKPQP